MDGTTCQEGKTNAAHQREGKTSSAYQSNEYTTNHTHHNPQERTLAAKATKSVSKKNVSGANGWD